jgi:hypothetical protein
VVDYLLPDATGMTLLDAQLWVGAARPRATTSRALPQLEKFATVPNGATRRGLSLRRCIMTNKIRDAILQLDRAGEKRLDRSGVKGSREET